MSHARCKYPLSLSQDIAIQWVSAFTESSTLYSRRSSLRDALSFASARTACAGRLATHSHSLFQTPHIFHLRHSYNWERAGRVSWCSSSSGRYVMLDSYGVNFMKQLHRLRHHHLLISLVNCCLILCSSSAEMLPSKIIYYYLTLT